MTDEHMQLIDPRCLGIGGGGAHIRASVAFNTTSHLLAIQVLWANLQIITSISWALEIKFPAPFPQFLRFLAFLQPTELLPSIGCFTHTLHGYTASMVLSSVLPIIVAALSWGVYFLRVKALTYSYIHSHPFTATPAAAASVGEGEASGGLRSLELMPTDSTTVCAVHSSTKIATRKAAVMHGDVEEEVAVDEEDDIQKAHPSIEPADEQVIVMPSITEQQQQRQDKHGPIMRTLSSSLRMVGDDVSDDGSHSTTPSQRAVLEAEDRIYSEHMFFFLVLTYVSNTHTEIDR